MCVTEFINEGINISHQHSQLECSHEEMLQGHSAAAIDMLHIGVDQLPGFLLCKLKDKLLVISCHLVVFSSNQVNSKGDSISKRSPRFI